MHASEKEGSGWYPRERTRGCLDDKMDYEQCSSDGEYGEYGEFGDESSVKSKTVEDT